MAAVSRRRFLEGSAVCAATLHAQEWARKAVDASPRKREWVTVKHDGRAVESFVARPQGSGKAPVMVVIHEIFGHTDWVESVTDEFAAAGFLAIAPDLLSGMGPNGGRTSDFAPNTAGQGIQKLPPDQVTADLNAVADFAKALAGSNGKVCVVGFSWGGSQSFRFATNRKNLAASFVFYGGGPAAEAITNIQAPVYGFYAGNDARINAGLPQTQEQMKSAGKKYETVTYDGAAHGFMRAGAQPDATDANKAAREKAWARIKELYASLK
jgi:carboxymethylenebutenolidase